jgi:hypothetical protein
MTGISAKRRMSTSRLRRTSEANRAAYDAHLVETARRDAARVQQMLLERQARAEGQRARAEGQRRQQAQARAGQRARFNRLLDIGIPLLALGNRNLFY